MPSGIDFLEMAFDELGLTEGATEFPKGENMAKDARNLLRLCEKCITDNEWIRFESGCDRGIQLRFSSINPLPDEVGRVSERIDSGHGWEEYE
jgi:hypothetical protein